MDDFATLPGGIYLGTEGDDVVNASTAFPPGVFDNLILTFGGDDSVNAGAGADEVLLGEGDDTGVGGSGADVILGEDGDDLLIGNAGRDTLEGDDGEDVLDGGRGDDVLGGGDGDDIAAGGAGRDVVDGGDGNDILRGEAGNDTVVGGAGNDTLSGGSGKDVFVFESGFGKDVVLGFQKGVDTLEIEANINGLPITSAADLAGYVGGSASSATITLGADTIRLVGVSKADLLANLNDYVKIV